MAFELALAYGADVLEIDVRLSRDGHVIVTHDASVNRTSDGHGNVRQLSLHELKKLDAAYRFKDLDGRSYRNQNIQFITLDELFSLHPTTRINIDIKDNTPEAAVAVAQSIEKSAMQKLVNVGSFHASVVDHFRHQSRNVTTAATQGEVARLYFGGKLPQPIPYTYLQIPLSYFAIPLTPAWFIRKAQTLNVQMVYWTVNDPNTMKMLIDRGADGLVTDRVDLASKLIQNH